MSRIYVKKWTKLFIYSIISWFALLKKTHKNVSGKILRYLAELWPKNSVHTIPIFDITQGHFWANWAKFFMGAQENIIIYQLVMRNLGNVWLLFSFFDFLGHCWLENGCGHFTTKKLAHWVVLLGQLLSRNDNMTTGIHLLRLRLKLC